MAAHALKFRPGSRAAVPSLVTMSRSMQIPLPSPHTKQEPSRRPHRSSNRHLESTPLLQHQFRTRQYYRVCTGPITYTKLTKMHLEQDECRGGAAGQRQ